MPRRPTLIRKRFFAHHYDAFAEWEVVQARGGYTYDCQVVSEDYKGDLRVFGGEEILKAIAAEQTRLDNQKQTDAFYANLTPGQMVHIFESPGKYERYEVIRYEGPVSKFQGRHQLRMVALVGDWSDLDLRAESVFAHNAKTGRVCRPHPSLIYEANPGKFKVDPRPLPPCTLLPPAAPPRRR